MIPDLPDDDDRAAALADEAVEFACRHHPSESPRFRRFIARLYIKTRLDPAARTTENTATLLGVGRRRVPEIEATALAKMRRELRGCRPELL
jgi:DNA-directed RNA polymerase sigma subunit (sigma70/sigma32)